MVVSSGAFVGVVGGAGTTRTVLELAGALARDGRSALAFDLDFATQGLSQYVDGRIDTDAVELLRDPEVPLADAVQNVAVAGEGQLGLLPAFAPLTALAEGMTAESGRRVADRIEEASETFDHVLLDVPPLSSNPAIGAVTGADRVVAVLPPTRRGLDSLPRERGRLVDVGREFDDVLAVGADRLESLPDADVVVPTLPDTAPEYRPATLESTGRFTADVAAVAEEVFDVSVLEGIGSSAGVVESIKRQIG